MNRKKGAILKHEVFGDMEVKTTWQQMLFYVSAVRVCADSSARVCVCVVGNKKQRTKRGICALLLLAAIVGRMGKVSSRRKQRARRKQRKRKGPPQST